MTVEGPTVQADAGKLTTEASTKHCKSVPALLNNLKAAMPAAASMKGRPAGLAGHRSLHYRSGLHESAEDRCTER